jgi:hypothetical protein
VALVAVILMLVVAARVVCAAQLQQQVAVDHLKVL